MKEVTVKVLMPTGKNCYQETLDSGIDCIFLRNGYCSLLKAHINTLEIKLPGCPAKEEGKDGTD